jgi:Uma2 family endonuclease
VAPETQSIAVYTTPEASTVLSEEDVLEGEAVLPEFSLSVGELFAELDRQGDDSSTINP